MSEPTKEPVLFQSRLRQRVLIATAYYGPIRVTWAFEAAGAGLPKRLSNFKRSGLLEWHGNKRARFIELNHRYPGYQQLRKLLGALGHAYGVPDVRRSASSTVLRAKFVGTERPEVRLDELFGSRLRTLVLLTVARCNAITVRDLSNAICYKPVHMRRIIVPLERQGILRTDGGFVSLNNNFCARVELIEFAKAVVRARPEYCVVPPKPPERIKGRSTKTGCSNWRSGNVATEERPFGVHASRDGAPLLFGSNARLRVLMALAHGPLRLTTLQRRAAVTDNVIKDLRNEVLIVPDLGNTGNTTLLHLNPGFPAYEELVALLLRLVRRFPLQKDRLPALPALTKGPRTTRWLGPINRLFGSEDRTETLLTVAASGAADGSGLRRVLGFDIHEIERSVHMFAAYGLLRSRREGNANVFELNPNWFAAKELRALLDRLLALYPRYAARAISLDMQMPARRRLMKDNAAKRKGHGRRP